MSSIPFSAITSTIEACIRAGAHRAFRVLSEGQVVRATRPHYKGGPSNRSLEFVVSVCKPNYAEREFIRKCKRAGEPIPVRKVQLRYAPKRRG